MILRGIFLVIVFYRLMFHESLKEKFLPTLVILLAPPSVAVISYSKLAGNIEPFSFGIYS